MSCPSELALSEAHETGADQALRQHLAACETCAAEWRTIKDLSKLARELPPIPLARPEKVRADLLVEARLAAPHSAGSRWPIYALAVTAAAAIIAIVVVRAKPEIATPPPEQHARISGEGKFTQSREGNVEHVRLIEGRMHVRLDQGVVGQQLRIELPSGHIEVAPSEFDVEVKDDASVEIIVLNGTVEMQTSSEPVILRTGDRWFSENLHETAFERAWEAMRRGDHRAAATDFEKAASSNTPLAEDAAYWRSVALAKSGDPATARSAFATFLDRFPTSPRKSEASVMRGWLELDAGNISIAEQLFQAGLKDPKSEVRASAAAGLEKLRPGRN